MNKYTIWTALLLVLVTPLPCWAKSEPNPLVETHPLEKELFEGWLLRESGEVIEGNFSIEWSGDKAKRIRHVLETRRPTIKDARLVVDREELTRFPKNLEAELAESYRALAVGLCAAEDGSCVAENLMGYTTHLVESAPELATRLFGMALLADPEQESALTAVDSLPLADRLKVWSEVLDVQPKAKRVNAKVAALFPPNVVPEGSTRAVEWLALYRTMERLKVHLINDPNAGTEGLVPAERKLGTYRHSKVWGRADLLGFRSPHLFLVTPIRNARAIRDCLLRGELVTGTLEKLFSGVERRRDEDQTSADHDMMIVFLFESKEEYLRVGENLRSRGQDARHAYTAGFFSPGDRISRFYLPEKGDPYERLKSVLAHELTHHWIFTSCPGFTNEEAMEAILKGRGEQPGHWIVEGFASMMQELAYDDEAGEFTLVNPKADRLDTIANSEAKNLLPWPRLFETTHATFEELDVEPMEPKALAPISWLEGRARIMSQTNYYYAQAAVACHYLFSAEEEGLREKLMQFVVAYYAGWPDGGRVDKAFGMDGAALGERAWKHAQEWGRASAKLR